ncbi:hypothetical protein NHL50_05775 [Acidimicrobiia bacterium EGI L10123]|uniref:hypothetical protein n=1 Tax=Salinilacustrithrix flava TaxID=2957203 RepID=UPI003D7C26E4|nr:hypothetical protein [Acidimicrobiia bacterium EGI L10123]
MRRVLLFAAFLLLLGLTTATAASFDVQAEDITSFSTDVSISVPSPPPPKPAYYLSGSPPRGALEHPEPGNSSPVISGKFQPVDSLILEDTAPGSGQVVYFMRWASTPQTQGILFEDKQVILDLYSPGQFSGTITAGLFDCPLPTTPSTVPVSEAACELMVAWTNEDDSLLLTSPAFDGQVEPGNELRLKVVNLGTAEWTIQWGYKSNRSANLAVVNAASP